MASRPRPGLAMVLCVEEESKGGKNLQLNVHACSISQRFWHHLNIAANDHECATHRHVQHYEVGKHCKCDMNALGILAGAHLQLEIHQT
eukprot:scaffold195651_cov17-Tisochrysis_lutea.AAC.1